MKYFQPRCSISFLCGIQYTHIFKVLFELVVRQLTGLSLCPLLGHSVKRATREVGLPRHPTHRHININHSVHKYYVLLRSGPLDTRGSRAMVFLSQQPFFFHFRKTNRDFSPCGHIILTCGDNKLFSAHLLNKPFNQKTKQKTPPTTGIPLGGLSNGTSRSPMCDSHAWISHWVIDLIIASRSVAERSSFFVYV